MSVDRKLALLVAALLLGLGVLWLAAGTRAPQAGRPVALGEVTARPSVGEGVQVQSASSGTAARSAEPGGVPEIEPASAAEASPEVQGEGALSLLVEDSEHEPLSGVRVVTVLDDEEGQRELRFVDAPRGGRGNAMLTDFLGHATCYVPSGRGGSLRIWSETPGFETRTVAFSPLAPGEDRVLVVRLQSLSDTGLARRVVDGETGEPLAGALVLVRQEARTLDGTETDTEGRFRIDWQGWLDLHLRVEAEGYTPALLVIAHGEVPEPIPLWRTATLVLTVTNHMGTSLGALDLSLNGAFSDAFPVAQRTADVRAETFALRTRTKSDGTARIEGLPARLPLELRLTGNPFGSARARLAPLAPGELRRLDWSSGRPRPVEGRLIDQDGLAVGGEDLWIRSPYGKNSVTRFSVPEDAPEERYFTYEDRKAVLHTATSGPDGSFQFDSVYPGEVLMGPAPGSETVAQWAKLVEIEDREVAETIELRCFRGLFAKGVVVDTAGNGHNSWVTVTHEGGLFDFESGTEPFICGPLIDDVHVFRATDLPALASEHVSRRPWKVAPDDEGLVLVLKEVQPGEAWNREQGRITGIVVDPASGRGLSARVTAYEAGMAPGLLDPRAPVDIEKHMNALLADHTSSALTNGMGGFELDHLAPGAYVLIARETDSTASNIHTIDDQRAAALARVVIPGRGDRVADVTIRIPRQASAVVRFPAGSWGDGDYWASIDGLLVSHGDWSSDDPFPIPSGLITLEVAESSGRRVFRTLDTPPGGSVVIDLESDQ